jgi:tellurite resistance protein TehA-like permease
MARVSLRFAWLEWVRTLYPGYFACVMATGIVSIALLLSHVQALSSLLLGIACAFLVGLLAIYILRGVIFAGELRQDLMNPAKVFGFFTLVAACGVLATRFALSGWIVLPAVLTIVAFVTWLALIYWTFSLLIFTNERPVEQSVNGSWLIAIVGTESLAITWVLLARVQPDLRAVLQVLAYAFWTFGVLVYLIFIVLIVYRFAFFRIKPSDLTPPYWINMGAMAITTVAGVRLLQVDQPTVFLITLRPYIEGFTVMMWAWGTWWIPLLIIIGIWKYLVSRELLTYDPSLWSVVFPLGMYAVAVELLSHLPGLEFLQTVDPWLTWIAFAAWVIVSMSWLWASATAIWRSTNSPPTETSRATPDDGLLVPQTDDLGG